MKNELNDIELLKKIELLLAHSREKVAKEINTTLLATYMKIGEAIVEEANRCRLDEQQEYKSLRFLSKTLSKRYGKGFSIANLHFMILLYTKYRSVQTLSKQLSWSHYCELLSISDDDKRKFYEKECSVARWSVRELRRQIESSLFERLLLSSGKINKEKVLELALKGNEINTPEDIIKDPYVFEFIGVHENKPLLESNLECLLIKQIEKFLLGLEKALCLSAASKE